MDVGNLKSRPETWKAEEQAELISAAERGESSPVKVDLGVAYPKDEPELSPGFYCQRYDGGNSILICTTNGHVIGQNFPFICLVGPDWPCLLLLYALIAVPCFLFFRWSLSGELQLTPLLVLSFA